MQEKGDNQNKAKIEECLKELIVNEKQLEEIKKLKEKKNICICVPIIPNITFPALELTYVAFLLKRYLDQNSPGKTKVLLYLMDTVDLLRPLLMEPKVYDAKTNLYLFRMYVSSIARSIARSIGDPSFAKHVQFRCVSSRVKEIIDTPNFMLFEEEINQEVNRLLDKKKEKVTLTIGDDKLNIYETEIPMWLQTRPYLAVGIFAFFVDLFLLTKDADFLSHLFGTRPPEDKYKFLCFIRGIDKELGDKIMEKVKMVYGEKRGNRNVVYFLEFNLKADPGKKTLIHYPLKYSGYSLPEEGVSEKDREEICKIIKNDPISFFKGKGKNKFNNRSTLETKEIIKILEEMFKEMEIVKKLKEEFKKHELTS